MRVRLTRKMADSLDGVDLSLAHVGDTLDLTRQEAELLIIEGWAESRIERRAACLSKNSRRQREPFVSVRASASGHNSAHTAVRRMAPRESQEVGRSVVARPATSPRRRPFPRRTPRLPREDDFQRLVELASASSVQSRSTSVRSFASALSGRCRTYAQC